MKNLCFSILFVLTSCTTLWADIPTKVILDDLDGHSKTLQLDGGTPTLLVFFASWCAPCKKEAPHLVAYQHSPDRKCAVIGIDVDTQPAKGKKFVRDLQLNYPVLSDPKLALADQLGVKGTPALLLIDGKGKLLHHGKRFDKKLIALLERL